MSAWKQATQTRFVIYTKAASAAGCISTIYSESLILAQIERWQRGLGMQVER